MVRPLGPALAAGLLLLFLLPPVAAAASLAAQDNRFEPALLAVTPGEVVEVRNLGRDAHTLTAVQGGAWPEVDLAAGESKGFTAPTAPGEYRFYCRYHASPGADASRGEMAGVLTVRTGTSPAGPPPASPGGARAAPGAEDLLPLAAVAAALLLQGAMRRTGR